MCVFVLRCRSLFNTSRTRDCMFMSHWQRLPAPFKPARVLACSHVSVHGTTETWIIFVHNVFLSRRSYLLWQHTKTQIIISSRSETVIHPDTIIYVLHKMLKPDFCEMTMKMMDGRMFGVMTSTQWGPEWLKMKVFCHFRPPLVSWQQYWTILRPSGSAR